MRNRANKKGMFFFLSTRRTPSSAGDHCSLKALFLNTFTVLQYLATQPSVKYGLLRADNDQGISMFKKFLDGKPSVPVQRRSVYQSVSPQCC